MPQTTAWEREYAHSTFLTKDTKPQADVLRFVKWLKKEKKKNGEESDLFDTRVLDLGSGTGRNSMYFASLGAKVTGFEISPTALDIAQKNSGNEDLAFPITYTKQSIGEIFPYPDSSADIVLDVTSSNSLTEAEREVYLNETYRVLVDTVRTRIGSSTHTGYFFVKALCKDGDDNAKHLLKQSPGTEHDTYVLPDVGVVERVWTRDDFLTTYQKYFTILHLEKKTSYTRMQGRVYKRNFWIAYMRISQLKDVVPSLVFFP